MPSLRQYTSAVAVAQLTGLSVGDITDNLLNKAEIMIDAYCADFYEGPLSKFYKNVVEYFPANTSWTTTSVTLLPNNGASDNYYNFTVIELLDGSNKGLIIPVTSSNGNVLSFTAVPGLSGLIACRVYQLGKFPMLKDVQTYKSIPSQLAQAVAFQCEFLLKNAKKINSGKSKKSEYIGENYSYTDNDLSSDTIGNRIAPMARDLLDGMGLTTQTI
jgi:hypothetical protein